MHSSVPGAPPKLGLSLGGSLQFASRPGWVRRAALVALRSCSLRLGYGWRFNPITSVFAAFNVMRATMTRPCGVGGWLNPSIVCRWPLSSSMVNRPLCSVAGLPVNRAIDSRALSLLPVLPALSLAAIRSLAAAGVSSAVWASACLLKSSIPPAVIACGYTRPARKRECGPVNIPIILIPIEPMPLNCPVPGPTMGCTDRNQIETKFLRSNSVSKQEHVT